MKGVIFLLCVCAINFSLIAQTILDWNTNNVAIGTFTPNNSPGASVTISGTNFSTLQGASPRYNTGYSGYANWNMNGLGLGVDFPNTSNTVVVDITFSNPLCGNISFNIHDLDGSTSGSVFEDKVIIDTWDQNNGTIVANATNFVFGNSGFCSGPLYLGGNNAANSLIGRCQNGAYNANSYGSVGSSVSVTLKSPTTRIKRVRITYTSAKGTSPDVNAYYTGSDPTYENIVIGNFSLTPTVIASPTVSGSSPVCSGTSTNLTASGSFSSYSWNTGQTGSTVSVAPSSTTTYTVTATNSNGCTATNTISIATKALPYTTADISNPIVCKNQTINLSSTPSSSTSTITYDFEASNPFTFVNSGTIAWYYGTAAKCGGSKAIYIGTSNSNNNYTSSQTSVDFAYLDIAITDCNATLNFSWKALGSSTDNLSVWIVPTSTTLTSGTQLTASPTILKIGGDYYNGASVCNSVNALSLVQGWVTSGQTIRLVFQARNGNAASANPAPMIDDVSITQSSNVTYSWTSSATSFTSVLQNPSNSASVSTIYTVTATGCNGCSKSATVALTVNSCTLPIELISFDGKCSNNAPSLEWSTASETNNDYFTVEESLDGQEFITTSVVEAAGNSNEILNYSIPISERNGPAYYRLSQTDFDGHMETFNTVYLNCNDPMSDWSLLPNPVNDQLEIRKELVSGFERECHLYSMDGKKVLFYSLSDNTANGVWTISVQDLPAGIYQVVILDNDRQPVGTIKKIVKL